jgi:hypothetical protein
MQESHQDFLFSFKLQGNQSWSPDLDPPEHGLPRVLRGGARFIHPHFFTTTGSAPGTTTSSSTFFSFLSAVVVTVPMKLKKRMAAGIN